MVGSQPLPKRTAPPQAQPVGNDATPRMAAGADVLRFKEKHTAKQPAGLLQVRMGREGESPTAGNVGRGIRRGASATQGVQMVITRACPPGRAFVFARFLFATHQKCKYLHKNNGKNVSICKKEFTIFKIWASFVKINLHISKKSSNFASSNKIKREATYKRQQNYDNNKQHQRLSDEATCSSKD